MYRKQPKHSHTHAHLYPKPFACPYINKTVTVKNSTTNRIETKQQLPQLALEKEIKKSIEQKSFFLREIGEREDASATVRVELVSGTTWCAACLFYTAALPLNKTHTHHVLLQPF